MLHLTSTLNSDLPWTRCLWCTEARGSLQLIPEGIVVRLAKQAGVWKQSTKGMIIWTKEEKLTGGWWELYIYELHDVDSSPKHSGDEIKEVIWEELERRKQMWNADNALIGQTQNKSSLRKRRRKLENNIKMYLKEIRDDANWVQLTQCRA
jgi:hypothetical protein